MSGGRPVGTNAKKVLGVSEGRLAGTTAVKGCDIVTSEGSPFGTSAGNTITNPFLLERHVPLHGMLHDEVVDMAFLSMTFC